MTTPTERFAEREESQHRLEQAIEEERRYGDMRQPLPMSSSDARGLRKYWRKRALIDMRSVRERFEEYGNISDRICR